MEQIKSLKTIVSKKEKESESDVLDVVIVGAGVSGLTAAYRLKQKEPALKFAVLEGKGRVGGRTLTVPLVGKTGSDLWDLGGQWVGSSQRHIMRLLTELGLKTYTQYDEGFKVHQLATDKVSMYKGSIPNLSWLALIDLHKFMSSCEKFQKQLTVIDPYAHPKAKQWDAMSLGAFMDSTLYTQGAYAAITAALRVMFGCEPSQISFLFYLLYIHMGEGLNKMIECNEGSAQQFRVDGGTQQISEILQRHIGEENVYLGDAVVHIDESESLSYVTVRTESGAVRKAKYVILACPPQAIDYIMFAPELSPERIDFSKRMPMGNLIKVIITYEKAFWREQSFSGEAVSDGGISLGCSGAMKPICVCYDATTANGNPALLAFIGGQAAVEWRKLEPLVRRHAVINHLSEFFGPKCSNFLDYAAKDWSQEPYTWGAPVSVAQTGTMKNFCLAIRKPQGRLHFAGTETATLWSGYINGAVQSGERAATEVYIQLKNIRLSQELAKSDLPVQSQEMVLDGKTFAVAGCLVAAGFASLLMILLRFRS